MPLVHHVIIGLDEGIRVLADTIQALIIPISTVLHKPLRIKKS
jgi:hypothetical protein